MSLPLPELDIAATAIYSPLVTFQWGDSSVARYCRGGGIDIVSNGETFLDDPSIGWAFDNAPGMGVEDSPLTLTIRADAAPMNRLTLLYPHAKTTVLVEEIAIGYENTRTELFSGRVGLAKVKPNGRQFLCTLRIDGVKSRLSGDLGLVAASSCRWPFGNKNGSPCGKDVDALTETVNIDGIWYNGRRNRIKLSGVSDLNNMRWAMGYVELDDLRIPIRRSIGDGRFDLYQFIPPYWSGTCKIIPGCAKGIANCRYWENENRYMAPGIKMPNRNPVFEQ